MLKKINRLTKNKDFKAVFDRGRFSKDQFFLLKYAKNDLSENRFGFVASLKVSKKATQRNLLKRRFREAVKSDISNIKEGYDLVFIIKKEALRAAYRDIKDAIHDSFRRSRLLKD